MLSILCHTCTPIVTEDRGQVQHSQSIQQAQKQQIEDDVGIEVSLHLEPLDVQEAFTDWVLEQLNVIGIHNPAQYPHFPAPRR